jgi:hypothetical protein
VPIEAEYAPLWPLAGQGALASLFLLEGSVADACSAVTGALNALRALPRARVFHAILLRKAERTLPEELRENLALIDEASLFLVPLESGRPSADILRPLLTRILP